MRVMVAWGLTLAAGCTGAEGEQDAANSWPEVAAEYADYTGTGGGAIGDHVAAFALVDQHGDPVDYRQFLGQVQVIDIAGVWCLPCQEAAETSQEVFDTLQSTSGAWLLTVLVQNVAGGPPGADDAGEWADTFSLDYPVLADELQAQQGDWALSEWPTYLFVAPDGEIVDRSDGGLPDAEILDRAAAVAASHGR